MNMITKEEYLHALNIVEKYHLQLDVKKAFVKKHISKYKDFTELIEGDYVECMANCSQSRNNITIGKKYLVRWVSQSVYNGQVVFSIRTDTGIVRTYKSSRRFFRPLNNE